MQNVVNQCAAEILRATQKTLQQRLVIGANTGNVTHHGKFWKIHCSKLRKLIR